MRTCAPRQRSSQISSAPSQVSAACGRTGRAEGKGGHCVHGTLKRSRHAPRPAVSYVTRKEMHDAKVPLDYRDYCAHLLIPLNRCRVTEMYLPWKCETLRNAYEKCQHNECALAARRPPSVRASLARLTAPPRPASSRRCAPATCDGGLSKSSRPRRRQNEASAGVLPTGRTYAHAIQVAVLVCLRHGGSAARRQRRRAAIGDAPPWRDQNFDPAATGGATPLTITVIRHDSTAQAAAVGMHPTV